MNLPFVVLGGLAGVGAVMTYLKSSQLQSEFSYMQRMSATVKEVSHGVMAEITGIAEPVSSSLKSPKTQKDCVYYHYIVERREERRTQKGGTTYQWAKVTDSKQAVPFYLDDGTGKIQLDLSGVDGVDAVKTFEGVENTPTGIKAALFGFNLQLTPDTPYRFTEYALGAGSKLYALGLVKGDEKGSFHLVPPNDGRPFIVSYKSEEALKSEKSGAASKMKIASVVLGFACVGLLYFGLA